MSRLQYGNACAEVRLVTRMGREVQRIWVAKVVTYALCLVLLDDLLEVLTARVVVLWKHEGCVCV